MDEKLANKIRGLLRKAEATQFEEEADAFLRKAQELMMTHGIDEERLWANDPSRRAKVETVKVKVPDNKPGAMEKRIILNKIARLNHCRMWYSPGTGKSTVAGFPNDLLFVEMLYVSIIKQMSFKEAMALAHSNGVHHKTFRSNFVKGFADRICERLQDAYAQVYKSVTEADPGTALVLRDRTQVVSEWMQNHGPQLGKSKSSGGKVTNSSSYASGTVAANSTDISGGRSSVGKGAKRLGTGS